MRILLDNNLPVAFAKHLVGFEVTHVRDLGWRDLGNGDLEKAALGNFGWLVTVDQNMRHQTSLKGMNLSVAVLKSKSNVIDDLLLLVPQLTQVLAESLYGEFVLVQLDAI